MDIQTQAKEIALKHAKALALELIEVAAIPALEAAVAKTDTKVDDAVVMALKEPLKAALVDLISKI